MGAIAGIFYPRAPKPVDPLRIRAMTDAQAHRGPDGSGEWTALGVGLGQRRLATIDIGGSAQPMVDDAGEIAVACDGTILNFAALRAELAAKGARFRTAGDAEVLVHGWRAWGPAMLDRLVGGFAIAIHDARTQALFLARDRLGVKPLHHAVLSDGALAFSSELKGVLAHPMLRRAADLCAVEDYLAYGYVPDDACLVAGVAKLPAGHFLLVERGRGVGRARQYWEVDFAARAGGGVADALVGRMREGVASASLADVPVGALLSGGVADAAVVALMAEASATAVPTAAIGFEGGAAPGQAGAVAAAVRDRASRADGGGGGCARGAGACVRRAVRGPARAGDVASGGAGARGGDGGAVGRGVRRGAGARRAVSGAGLAGAGARGGARGVAARGVRAGRARGAGGGGRRGGGARGVRAGARGAARAVVARGRAHAWRTSRGGSVSGGDARRARARCDRPGAVCGPEDPRAGRGADARRPGGDGDGGGGARAVARPSAGGVRGEPAGFAAGVRSGGQGVDRQGDGAYLSRETLAARGAARGAGRGAAAVPAMEGAAALPMLAETGWFDMAAVARVAAGSAAARWQFAMLDRSLVHVFG